MTLKSKINTEIRERLSPRHVPDEIYAIPGVPQTLNGKKLEVPVKRTLSGISMNKLVNIVSMKNSDSLKFFIEFVEELK